MLGHKLGQVLAGKSQVFLTVRQFTAPAMLQKLCPDAHVYTAVDAGNFQSIVQIVDETAPHLIINCLVCKRVPSSDAEASCALAINSILPHRLAQFAPEIQVICISSDGVFSGKKGNYSEADLTDAQDFYGKTKALGEVHKEGCVNIRTSIIGRQIEARDGLLEWVLSQQGQRIRGFEKSIFSGLSTIALASLLDELIAKADIMTGTYHVSSQPLSKYRLLVMMKEYFDLDLVIEKEDGPSVDRSLDSSKFRVDSGLVVPSWEEMMPELVLDSAQYLAGS